MPTIVAVRTMEGAGVPCPQAEAIASAMQNAIEHHALHLATKADLYKALLVHGSIMVSVFVGALVALR